MPAVSVEEENVRELLLQVYLPNNHGLPRLVRSALYVATVLGIVPQHVCMSFVCRQSRNRVVVRVSRHTHPKRRSP